MNALRKTTAALTRKPLRSRSARSVPRTSPRAKRCWMPALATTAIRAPASACATDARPPKALLSRRFARASWLAPCGCGTSAPGASPALVLGPLAVDASCRKLGVGAALMNHALAAAKARGHGAVILLGDAAYYARFGFSAAKTVDLSLPGPFERERLLAVELREARSKAPPG